MTKRCEIVNCPNAENRKNQNKKSLFLFPQMENLSAKWIKATGKTNWTPNKSSAVCEIHFKPEHFSNTKLRRRLKPDVVPTEYLSFSSMTNITANEAISTEDSDIEQLQKTEGTEIITQEMDVTKELNEIQSVTPIIEIEKTRGNKNRKQKASTQLKNLRLKFQKIEEENNELKAVIQSLQEKHEEELKFQTDLIRHLYTEQRKKYKEKLANKNKQLKILQIQIKWQNSNIKNSLTSDKNMNMLNNTTYNILNNDFDEISFIQE